MSIFHQVGQIKKKENIFKSVWGAFKKTQTDCRAVVLHVFRNQERAIIIRLTVSLLGPVFFAFQTQLKLWRVAWENFWKVRSHIMQDRRSSSVITLGFFLKTKNKETFAMPPNAQCLPLLRERDFKVTIKCSHFNRQFRTATNYSNIPYILLQKHVWHL